MGNFGSSRNSICWCAEWGRVIMIAWLPSLAIGLVRARSMGASTLGTSTMVTNSRDDTITGRTSHTTRSSTTRPTSLRESSYQKSRTWSRRQNVDTSHSDATVTNIVAHQFLHSSYLSPESTRSSQSESPASYSGETGCSSRHDSGSHDWGGSTDSATGTSDCGSSF